MSLGIPGDPVMALILGALLIQGIQPGPQADPRTRRHFLGAYRELLGSARFRSSYSNVPLIGIWVKLLQIPYRYMFPCALFFIAVGVYSTNNSLFEVGEALVFGVVGMILLALDFPVSPILPGYVLGPMVEENFRRSLVLSRGDPLVFLERPISASFMVLCLLLVVLRYCLRSELISEDSLPCGDRVRQGDLRAMTPT